MKIHSRGSRFNDLEAIYKYSEMGYFIMWLYENKEFDGEDLSDFAGFVYIITNSETNKKYIGKKLFKNTRHVRLKSKKRREKRVTESDWKDYFGSNKVLIEDVASMGADKFQREILRLCATKGECNYWEAHYQFKHEVLLHPEDWYNEHIWVRVHRTHVNKIIK